MARAFVSVGSNIDPEQNVRKAVGMLAREVGLTGISTVYLTEPLGRPEQEHYYNCVVEIDAGVPPLELKALLRRIEESLGRVRSADRFAPRTIDLDLILCDGLVMNTEGLVLPDPEITRRPFLAIPLSELAPEVVLPGSPAPVAKIAAGMVRSGMEPLRAYTRELRREHLGWTGRKYESL